ncbi:MAG: HTTM domain-containing protein [Cellulophaga sp.]
MLNQFLFKKIDIGSLLIFRIFFGILISLECYGAILTGWVKNTLIDPTFTFSFIGFEWLQPLAGNGMYFYFLVMGTLGVFISIGYKYRYSILAFTFLWVGVYLMQKTSYNNHYYLLALISFIMIFLPANKGYSIDAKQNPLLRSTSMHSYVKWIIVIQIFIMYTYGSIAKLYGDWFDLSIIKILMQPKADYYLIGSLLQEHWVHIAIAVTGISFDLVVVPALLWKPTRKIAFILSLLFHLFNSAVFQIGIFPYMALAFSVFFFEPETIRNIFFKKSILYRENKIVIPPFTHTITVFFGLYFLIQLILPIRHHFIPDDVLWTEEGHRMSWRMMLRSRSGIIEFKVVNKADGSTKTVPLENYLTRKQRRKVAAYPDFIWQFAQHLKKEYAKNNVDISVYVNSKMSVNDRSYETYINSEIDLANVSWLHFTHNEWILPSNFE